MTKSVKYCNITFYTISWYGNNYEKRMADDDENQVAKSSVWEWQILMALQVHQSGRRRRIRTDYQTDTMDIGSVNKWQILLFGSRKTNGQCCHHQSGKQETKTSGKKRGSQVAIQVADF